MASEPSPGFVFYVKDWRSSRKVQSMPFATRGMYLEMLLEQWEAGSVPSTPAELASLLGGTKAAWEGAWLKLSACFVARKKDGRLVNPKLEAVRRERLKYKKAQAESGLRGAAARWQRHGNPIGSPSKPNGLSMAENSSSSSLALASSSSSSRTEGTPAPPIARSRRPIFTGQRLRVFEWQLDDLTRMLGPHVNDFDLHSWFFDLDAHAVKSACVIPQRDNGAWLQGQTLAEAQRRGLPIAVAPSVPTSGKLSARMAAMVANAAPQEEAG